MDSYDITIKSGDEWEGITFSLGDGINPIDLNGASIKMQVREKPSCSDYVLEFSTDNDLIVIDDPDNGHFYIAPQVIDVTAKKYVYDIEIKNTSLGSNKTILEGSFIVEQDITR